VRSETDLLYHEELASDEASIKTVEDILLSLSDRFSLSEECSAKILVCVSEAVHNAIVHGNRCSTDKTVSLKIQEYQQGFRIQISDQGKGFDPSLLPDPTTESNRQCCGGRGVFIIKTLADQCKFSDQGRTVELVFQR